MSSWNFETYVKKAPSEFAAFQPTKGNNVYTSYWVDYLATRQLLALTKYRVELLMFTPLGLVSMFGDDQPKRLQYLYLETVY
jgi:hypothetical protein